MCSELSWPLDIVPNAHSIGLHAIQTSTPRNANDVLPALKTPATDFNSRCQTSAPDDYPPVWCCQTNEAEDHQQHEALPDHLMLQPHAWPGENDANSYVPDNTLRHFDSDKDEHGKRQQQGCKHSDNAEGYDACVQSRYTVVHGGQTVPENAHHIHNSCTGPTGHEHQSHALKYAQPQQNEYGKISSEHQWNQHMYELEQQDVTDVTQSQTADNKDYYSNNVQIQCPFSDNYGDVNAAGQLQWSVPSTFPQVMSDAAQPDYNSVGTPATFADNMQMANWSKIHVPVAPSGRPTTEIASKGDGDFGGYRVQYRQQPREQVHKVSAAGDTCEQMATEQADAQTAATVIARERFQQVFLHSGKLLLELCPNYQQVAYFVVYTLHKGTNFVLSLSFISCCQKGIIIGY